MERVSPASLPPGLCVAEEELGVGSSETRDAEHLLRRVDASRALCRAESRAAAEVENGGTLFDFGEHLAPSVDSTVGGKVDDPSGERGEDGVEETTRSDVAPVVDPRVVPASSGRGAVAKS